MYTWVATYKEIAQKLLTYEDKQNELITLLKEVGVGINPDLYVDGSCELDEIDPFTFFSYLNKYGDKKRLEILQVLHRRLELTSPAPKDVYGLQTTHPLKVWLFPFKISRFESDIPLLWELFRQTIARSIDNATLWKVMNIKSVGKKKLSICWFYADPEYYLPLDSLTSNFLRANSLRYTFSKIAEYEEIRAAAIKKFNEPPFVISGDAWRYAQNMTPQSERGRKNKNQILSLTDIESIARDATKIEISSVRTLLDDIVERKGMASNDTEFLYRGQSNAEHLPKPGVYRDDHPNWIKNEHIMFKEMESALPSEFTSCKCTFDRLVKMQHYGLPTRLLDITANPLVALFFACHNDADKEKNGKLFLFEKNEKTPTKYSDSDAVSVVSNIARRSSKFDMTDDGELDFLLHEIRCCEKPHFQDLIDKEDIKAVFFVKPKMDNARIVKQDGAFFLFGANERKTVCPKLEDYFDPFAYIIPAADKPMILKELENMGINEASLFPEIDHVARFIREKY